MGQDLTASLPVAVGRWGPVGQGRVPLAQLPWILLGEKAEESLLRGLGTCALGDGHAALVLLGLSAASNHCWCGLYLGGRRSRFPSYLSDCAFSATSRLLLHLSLVIMGSPRPSPLLPPHPLPRRPAQEVPATI